MRYELGSLAEPSQSPERYLLSSSLLCATPWAGPEWGDKEREKTNAAPQPLIYASLTHDESRPVSDRPRKPSMDSNFQTLPHLRQKFTFRERNINPEIDNFF